ncbi:gluconate kinase [Adhaeribacter aerolatus]|uniref:Gluconate kinase n=1 Tax=Adhaeribacter aerolatus TaxID=670289 RepID=A0A512B106_9BACT|nr:gluconokinase [Adhaeribacter aerolatus]GEO05648.1 gluconate kinase [Adhaeribacter aerolatus]
MPVIIGLDIGTSSTKAIAFDEQGKVLSSAYQGYAILNPEPNYSEQDPDEVFRAVLLTLQKSTSQLNGATPAGISFSSAMHSLIAIDAQGKPLTNCLIWADNRSQVEADALRATPTGLNIYHHTGTPIHPMSPLCKLLWFRQHQPELLQQTHKFISIKEYVWFKFFGQFKIDYSIASATGLFDIYTQTWYKPALAAAGISATQLSEPVNPFYQVAGLPPEYATLTGLSPNVPFIIGASDGCLANLGTGAIAPGQAALTIGTSGAIRVTAPQPAADPHQRLFSYILAPNQYIVGGPVNNGGIILRWFRDNFAEAEKAEAAKLGVDPYDILSKEAATVPAGCEGLLFLPYLLGERAPIWDAQARGVFFGVSITHTRAHFLRAVFEGILFGIYQVGQALTETTGSIEVIYASGGFARSPFWVQLVADIFNKKVILADTFESSAWGAAIMGLQALHLTPAATQLPDPSAHQQEYLPNPDHHAVYMQNFSIFEKLYPLLKDQLAAIGNLPKE